MVRVLQHYTGATNGAHRMQAIKDWFDHYVEVPKMTMVGVLRASHLAEPAELPHMAGVR
jgi:hypothetical protein